MERGTTPLQTSPRVFGHFLAPGSPGREWRRMLELDIQDAGEYTLCTREENTRGQGREGSL